MILLSHFLIPANSQQFTERNNILVIHSYHQGLEWTDDISMGINSVFRNENVEIHYEYLDTKRNSSEEYYQQLVEFEHFKSNLSNIDFKLIICSDNNALRFIMENGEALYPNIPIVFCGVNNFTNEMIDNRRDITGVMEVIDYVATLDLIKQLHPDRRNIILIIDRTPTGVAVKNELEVIIQNRAYDNYTFEFYQDFVLHDVPEKISSLDDNNVIYLLTFNRDIEGNFISYYDGIKMIRGDSKVPIYGAWDFYFGNGIIGGMLTTGVTQGKKAAEIAIQILKGTPIEDIEISKTSPNEMMFDYEEVNRFKINLNQLPDNAIIINKPQNWFQSAYKPLLFMAILSSLALVILGVRYGEQKRKQKQLRNMNLELANRVKEKTSDLTNTVLIMEHQNEELQSALDQIRSLKGIIPICSKCKNIRNDQGFWKKVEHYISENTEAVFSHSLCPDCIREVYPGFADDILSKE